MVATISNHKGNWNTIKQLQHATDNTYYRKVNKRGDYNLPSCYQVVSLETSRPIPPTIHYQ